MSRLVEVGRETYVRDEFPAHINLAFDAYEDVGSQPWEKLDPHVRLASFVRSLPEKGTEAVKPSQVMLDLGMAFDITTLDAPPRIDFPWGSLPTGEPELEAELSSLHGKVTGGTKAERETAKKQLAAVAQVVGHLSPIREAYWERCHSVWAALQLAEWIASDHYYAFLVHNRWLAGQERDRYLAPKSGSQPAPKLGEDFEGMRRGLALIRKARTSTQIDQIKHEQFVVQAVSLGLCAMAIFQQVNQGRIIPSSEDTRRLREATGLMTMAAQNLADAMERYLETVKRQASQYPILTLLGPLEVRENTMMYFSRQIEETVEEAHRAVDELMVEARRLVIPATFQKPTPSSLAQEIADSSRTSIWKVPFFLERAIQSLPGSTAEDVDHVVRYAGELESGGGIKSALALGGIDTAMMAAPAAGPIGVIVAIEWGLIQVIRSINEYRELSTLFKASIDPDYLLRGLDHEPASRVSVLLSLLGLIVV